MDKEAEGASQMTWRRLVARHRLTRSLTDEDHRNQGLVLRYPRINADFRQLDKSALLKVLKHYGVTPKPEIEQPELAITTARLFSDVNVQESEVVDKFVSTHCRAVPDPSARKQMDPFRRERTTRCPAC